MSVGYQAKHPFEWVLEVGIFLLLLLTLAATSGAAYFTKKQWETADDQEKRSLRAYLGIADYKVDRAAGAISFIIANGGQTSARNIRIVRNLVLDPAWKEYAKNFDFADLPETAGASRGSAFLILPQKTFPVSIPVDFDKLDQAKQGTWTAFLYGHIDYIDVFGRSQNCTFAFYSIPRRPDEKGQLMALDWHNNCT